MGTYINPGNAGFSRIAGKNYVDKTGMIALINERINSEESLICVSRPRRFGKSYAAKMLTAYYDCSCDSHALFDDRIIAAAPSYADHLNQYNVIYLDITSFISSARRQGIALSEVPDMMVNALLEDLKSIYPEVSAERGLTECLISLAAQDGGKQFIFVIDEWDAMIREARNDNAAQENYLDLLREWFKNGQFTPKVVAAAYMTGILPIKKDGSESAVSDFLEFSMLEPGEFAEYTGFSEKEIRSRFEQKGMDFQEVKAWYDGYDIGNQEDVYNPYSVMSALRVGKCKSFWRKTSAAESLRMYINMDFDGLQETIARLIAGERIPVSVDSFQNDTETFSCADDILTLLIHLGYLTWHEQDGTAQIPNEEVRQEFAQFLTQRNHRAHLMTLIQRSEQLLRDTIAENEEAVAAALEEIRGEQYAPQYYNNEQALRAIIKYAYFAVLGQYVNVEEMPSGKGLADVVFIPAVPSRLPAMVVELKWNKTAGGAIEQIRKKHYTDALKPFAGNILLVGINYDEKSGKHSCRIEEA